MAVLVPWTAAAVLLFVSAVPAAQLVGGDWLTHLQADGAAAGEGSGRAVALGGDYDGDGLPDLVLGAPEAAPGGLVLAGAVEVRSGLDGTLILRLDGARAGAAFGAAVAAVGDVNGDGVPEILVGAPFDSPGGRPEAGTATLYSGASGAVLWSIAGPKDAEKMGNAVAEVGDVDGDGAPDVVIGSHAAFDNTVRHAGRAVVLSGATGALLFNFAGPQEHAHFGFGVAGPGDLDGDGVPDVAVGGYGVETLGIANAGAVMAYSGADGHLLWQYDGLRVHAHRGEKLAPAGDFDGDGVPDLLDGSQRSLGKPFAVYAGAVVVHSGVDGSILFERRGTSDGEGLGSSVASAGDLDGDGLPEFLVGAPGADPNGKTDAGQLLVLTGGTGDELRVMLGATPGDNLGLAVDGGVDVNGDGFLDHLVGAPGGDPAGMQDAGHSFLFGYHPMLLLSAGAVSAAAGGRIDIALDFPLDSAGLQYGLLFSKSGPGPSWFAGLEVPLTQDSAFFHTSQGRYPAFLVQPRGLLDAAGDAVPALDAVPGQLASFAGSTIWVCAVTQKPGVGLKRTSAAGVFTIDP